MAPYRISVAAANGIKGILDFGYDRWGKHKADAYLDGLGRALDEISEHPLRFAAIDDVLPGLRRRVWRSHAVFFEFGGAEVLIVRVLGRQDPANQVGLE